MMMYIDELKINEAIIVELKQIKLVIAAKVCQFILCAESLIWRFLKDNYRHCQPQKIAEGGRKSGFVLDHFLVQEFCPLSAHGSAHDK